MPLPIAPHLRTILERKREEIRNLPCPDLEQQTVYDFGPNAFLNALKAPPRDEWAHIILEYQSKAPLVKRIGLGQTIGKFSADHDPYGLSAICIVGDKHYSGSPQHVERARSHTSLPIVYMDFIIDPRQIELVKKFGADAVVLVAQILEINQLRELIVSATDLGLDALVEVTTQAELKIALDVGADLIGINNRDWNTDQARLRTTVDLTREIPDGVIIISESGFQSANDIASVLDQTSGRIRAVLVSRAVMECKSAAQFGRKILELTKHR